jgi:dienelactone hydrolase
MTTIILYHHALGQTQGFLGFAEQLRAEGHTVHTPDLFEGKTFDEVDDGVAHAREVGFDVIGTRGTDAAAELPADVVYAGFSLGAMPAQQLAQTRPGAKGGLLYHSGIPSSEFGVPWPEDVPLQIHIMENDPYAEEDIPAAKELVSEAGDGALFLYPGSGHLFADPSSNDYDEEAAVLLMERTLAFLQRVG